MATAHRDPADLYLSRLGTDHSRVTARSALRTVARILDVEAIDWGALTYGDLAFVRAELGQFSVAWGNTVLSVLRGVLREAQRLGVLDAATVNDVFELPRIRGSSGRLGRDLPESDIVALLDTLDLRTAIGRRDGALLALLVDGAFRRSETVMVEATGWSAADRVLTLAQGKGRKRRVVPFPQWSAELIDAWLDIHPGDGLMLRSIDRWGNIGASMSATSVPLVLNRLCEQAGIEPVSAHAFRARRLTQVITHGDLSLARDMAGHSSISTTSRYDRRGLDELVQVIQSVPVMRTRVAQPRLVA
jgi:integrase/recombinase XerD